MNNKQLRITAIVILNFITFSGYAQNVGIGQSTPASKLDIKGNLTIGSAYSGTAAPSDGAIIAGKVGIGNSSPSELLTVGTSAPVTIGTTGNVKISSLGSGNILMSGTGGLVTTVSTPIVANTYLQWNGSAYTWATSSSTLANLTAGTGISSFTYNGSGAATIGLANTTVAASSYGNSTSVPTFTVNAQGQLTAAGNVAISASGIGAVTSVTGSSAITVGGTSTAPVIGLSTVSVSNGGTGVSTLTSNGILYGNGGSAIGATAAGTTGQVLTNVSGVPTWSTFTATTVGGWALAGNGGTTAGTNFIGTTDAKDVVVKTDGFEGMRVSNGGGSAPGNVVIGSGDGAMSLIGGTLRAPSYGSALIGNATGVNLTIEAGAPTGKAGSGSIIFQALAANVGSPGNTPDLSIMAEVMRITNMGALSFGSTGTATGNGNNVLISGGNSATPSWGQLPLNDATNAVTGTLGVGNGGTGLSSYTAGSILDASSSGVVGQIADVAAGSYLRSVAAGSVPVWSTLTLPNAATKGDLLYASGTNVIGNLSDIATGSVLLSGGVGLAPSWGQVGLTTAVSGVLPIANGGTNSGTALSGSSIMISNGSAIVQGAAGSSTTVLHGNAGGTPSYGPVNLAAGGDITGTLPVGNGGTGLTSYTVGDIVYASTTSALSKLSDVTTGNVLISGGTGVAPSWGQVGTTAIATSAVTYAKLQNETKSTLLGNPSSTTAAAPSEILLGTGFSFSGSTLNFTPSTSGTVTSVATGSGLTGGTITSTGTIALANGSAAGQVFVTGATPFTPALQTMSGDAKIASTGAVTVQGLQGVSVSSTAPTNGQVLTYNSGTTSWAPATASSSTGWSLTGNGSTTPGTNYIGTSDPNDLVFKTGGTEDMRIDNATGNVVIGAGDATATVTGNTLRGPAVTGTNKVGVDLTIEPGNGTGTSGSSGNIIFETAPSNTSGTTSTATTMTEAMRINSAGNVGFGTNAPAAQVDINGNLALRNTVITGASGSSYTLNPNGFSFVEVTSTGGFTLKTITAGVNGQVVIIWCSTTNMTLSTGGNITAYNSVGGNVDIGTFMYDTAHAKWIMIAAQ